jgi:hypothetical protein
MYRAYSTIPVESLQIISDAAAGSASCDKGNERIAEERPKQIREGVTGQRLGHIPE